MNNISDLGRIMLPLMFLSAAPAASFAQERDLMSSDYISDYPSEQQAYLDSVAAEAVRVRDIDEILASLPEIADRRMVKPNPLFGPRVFSGYRHMTATQFAPTPLDRHFYDVVRHDVDEIFAMQPYDDARTPDDVLAIVPVEVPEVVDNVPPIVTGNIIPDWLRASLLADRIQQDFLYEMMLDNSGLIDYAYWDLPEPPRLPEEDTSFDAYLKKLDLPEVDNTKVELRVWEIDKTHWLHTLNTGLQFSQAYLSDNWYQGGNNNISLFFNFLWDVQLNPVWHPNFMLQSTLSYKLGLNSASQDTHHNYSISQDLFQYNFKMGLKATNNWYYSLTTQFKTQMLKNYEANSDVLKADFLSSGDLTVGLGMTYSKSNKSKTVVFNASISPLSYNLKTCISEKIDHSKFGMAQDKRFVNEIGSSAELTFKAVIAKNINYNSRLFLFSDYKYFLSDWENTLSFQFNRYLSTQIYAHLRYDTSVSNPDSKWGKLMLKEILSFGLTYTFSTK